MAERPRVLHHLTTLTGHVAPTSRRDVSDHVVATLQAVVDADGGLIPAADVWVDIIRPPDALRRRPREGAAAFTIQDGREPGGLALATNVACWRQEEEDEAWEMAAVPPSAYTTGRPIVRPPLPWLVTTLLPGLATIERGRIGMLADLERCLAWALIETPI